MKYDNITYIVIGTVLFIVVIIFSLYITKNKKKKGYKKILDDLEVQKNLIGSIPVTLEISKIDSMNKNEDLKEKYDKWNKKIDYIKNELLTSIDDQLIELDTFYDKGDYSTCDKQIAVCELEMYKIKKYTEDLLLEIKEITSSEEKYRSNIIKFKAKYRKINNEYHNHNQLYDEMQESINLQLENIEKMFLNFEKAMDENDYAEVVHIIKALTAMTTQMEQVIHETPDLMVMAKELIPQKIKEVCDTSKELEEEGYPLDYLNLDYNIEEARKNVESVLDRVRVLNLEDCTIELKTILDYLDSLFVDFEKERLSKKVYDEISKDFAKKLAKTNEIVEDVTSQLDKIESTYDLSESDVVTIKDEEKILVVINVDYKKMISKVENKSTPYSELHKEVEELTVRLKNVTEQLDGTLKSLGTMYEDEQRAREQLEEIEKFLKASKAIIRDYKLPVISDKYFVQLNEANEAISEVISELSKKPIVIKTLNTRVDTARDLVLKLYNTTSDMTKVATLSERCILYANRFRDFHSGINKSLDMAEKEFFKGNYQKALDYSFRALDSVDNHIVLRIQEISELIHL